MRNSLTIAFVVFSTLLFAQKQTPQEYIEKYKDLAIIEMHRSGVPASITLAQGILESSSGNSRLAKYANNHFGIKCKGNWEGNVIYADDDAPDECFRAYDNVLQSYQDHSDFLQRNWRYHPLFELERTDYKGWCHGLRKAGYATNPKYGVILINLIERYDLAKFDYERFPGTGLDPLVPGQTINNVPVKNVGPGESISSIAKDNYVKDRHIRKWNDLPSGTELNEGDLVYLKPKRRRGSEANHTVSEGESMHDISQKYGIKLKQLYKKNRMDYGLEPAVGEVLEMQKKRDSEDPVALAEKEVEWEEKVEEVKDPVKEVVKTIDTTKAGALEKVEIKSPDFHLIEKGDNIYRIAERYHVFEEDILRWNVGLNPSTMTIGQKIYLSAQAAENAIPTEVSTTKKIDDTEADQIAKDITVDGPVFHIVQKGETLYGICKRYGITEQQLKTWNGLESIIIKIDQRLQVSE